MDDSEPTPVLEAAAKKEKWEKKEVVQKDKKDLAYSGKSIGMHTDSAYRYPTPDYQLLHAIEHCSCDLQAENYTDTHNCQECYIFNTFTDGLAAADRIYDERPELFESLHSTNVRSPSLLPLTLSPLGISSLPLSFACPTPIRRASSLYLRLPHVPSPLLCHRAPITHNEPF
jgi:hypothetical protein